MNKLKSFVLGVLVISLLSNCDDSNKKLDTFLFIGQSNMISWGDYNKINPILMKQFNDIKPRVRLRSNFGENNAVPFIQRSSDYAQKYLSKFNIEGEMTFDPIFSFALDIGQTKKDSFLILKYLFAGASLYGSYNPDWTEEKYQSLLTIEGSKPGFKAQLYKKLLTEIDSVNKKLVADRNKHLDIKCVFWFGGQKDGKYHHSASEYQLVLSNLIEKIRIDLKNPDLPFVIFQDNSIPEPHCELIRLSNEIISNKIENVHLINNTINPEFLDFPKYSDQLHYSTEGVLNIGFACSKIYKEI